MPRKSAARRSALPVVSAIAACSSTSPPGRRPGDGRRRLAFVAVASAAVLGAGGTAAAVRPGAPDEPHRASIERCGAAPIPCRDHDPLTHAPGSVPVPFPEAGASPDPTWWSGPGGSEDAPRSPATAAPGLVGPSTTAAAVLTPQDATGPATAPVAPPREPTLAPEPTAPALAPGAAAEPVPDPDRSGLAAPAPQAPAPPPAAPAPADDPPMTEAPAAQAPPAEAPTTDAPASETPTADAPASEAGPPPTPDSAPATGPESAPASGTDGDRGTTAAQDAAGSGSRSAGSAATPDAAASQPGGYTVGGAYFDGLGGGFEVSFNGDRAAITGFVGAGVGGSVTAGATTDVPTESSVGGRARVGADVPGLSGLASGSLQVNAGTNGVSATGAVNMGPRGSLTGQVAGGVAYDPETGRTSISTSTAGRQSFGTEASVSVQGTAVVDYSDAVDAVNGALERSGQAALAEAEAHQALADAVRDGLSGLAGRIGDALSSPPNPGPSSMPDVDVMGNPTGISSEATEGPSDDADVDASPGSMPDVDSMGNPTGTTSDQAGGFEAGPSEAGDGGGIGSDHAADRSGSDSSDAGSGSGAGDGGDRGDSGDGGGFGGGGIGSDHAADRSGSDTGDSSDAGSGDSGVDAGGGW